MTDDVIYSGEDEVTHNGIYWGYLRAHFRDRKYQTGDVGAAMFAMVKLAREDGCPDFIFDRLVEPLREDGALP